MDEDRHFSFRWGIPLLDMGFVVIPNFFFAHYVKLGLTRDEFLFVLHLACRKFESPRGRARVSLGTIAKEMGCSVRQVQRWRESLEKKAALIVALKPGRVSEYNFQPLSLAMLRSEMEQAKPPTHDTHVTPTHDTHVTPPMTPTSPHENNKNKKKRTTTTGSQDENKLSAVTAVVALKACGVEDVVAQRLAGKHSVERIMEVVKQGRSNERVENLPGWVISALRGNFHFVAGEVEKANRTKEDGQVINCMYVRNPHLGECPSEEKGGPAYPWCKHCDRGRQPDEKS